MGAEYYSKDYINAVRVVARWQAMALGDMSRLITDGDHGSPTYYDDGVPYILSETVEQGYIDDSKIRYITPQKHEELNRSALHPGDVIVTKTGAYFGKSAVIPDDLPEANTSSHVAKITLKRGYNPYFVSAFLNCSYGYSQLRRRGIKATRPEIALLEFDDILIPKLSDEFDAHIEEITRRGIDARTEAIRLYTQAQQTLNDAIGFNPAEISQKNTAVKSFSQAFSAGRIDAEYFMPEYDELLEALSGARTIGELCRIHTRNYKPDNGTEYRYIELADIGTYGNITGATTANGADLPTRARRIVKTGQVIVSSIEGSLQSCALITGDYDSALCSTGFYVIDAEEYNPETLLMLFKSEAVQKQMKRGCSGTILASISEEELKRVRLPYIDEETQKNISDHVKKSFALRKEAEQLIAHAVKSVELAIEDNKPSR